MAGRIPEETIEDIRHRADLVDVIGSYGPLKQRGSDYWACCPFHKEKTPSFKVSATRQTYYCFGCKKSGNVFSFLMEQENVDFVGAVRMLAQRVGVRIPEPEAYGGEAGDGNAAWQKKEKLLALHQDVTRWYQQKLGEGVGTGARQYLDSRKLPGDAIQTFGLGYAPNAWDEVIRWGETRNYPLDLLVTAGLVSSRDEGPRQRHYDRFRDRLMFPIWDELGRVVGFSGRILTPDSKAPKYVNTPETPLFHKGRLLYGLHMARQAFKDMGYALVCEGQIDVIACHRAGLINAVAPQGTAFTEEQCRMLKRFTQNITLAFDADEAGAKAVMKSIGIAHGQGLTVKVVVLPEGDDPDSILSRGGNQALMDAMGQAQEAMTYVFEMAAVTHDINSPQGKSAIVRSVLEVVATLTDTVTRATYCQWLSQRLALPEQAIFDGLNQILNAQQRATRRGSRNFRRSSQPRQHGHAAAPPQPQQGGGSPDAPRATPAGGHEPQYEDRNDYGAPDDEPPGAPTPPPFAMPLSLADQAELTLLDLAIHHGFLAHELVDRLPPESVSGTPIGKALNQVIACAAQGEWSEAADQLTGDLQLASNPHIARILVETNFGRFDPEHTEEKRRLEMESVLQKAMEDCLNQLSRDRLEQRTRTVQMALVSETDPEKVRQLQTEFMQLVREKQQMQTPLL
ncbi:MAG: DNA primase [Lentisphaerae bacterium]|jgi:DNA primase|nr:DNA primase [Lentisphaerota bacterium]MBT4820639.1 DNA primase [Lentisphaerota bacterium]MBT5607060.1 DNA primase [Lentisphaerota bacterium]MBT7055865.1 DNA primase [Lentisphaerota bacterium]MBT7845884.1 DNA primase [Lentisphaerota bacterium]